MSRASSRTYDNLGLFSVDAPVLLPTTVIPLQLRDPADIELARQAIDSGEMIGLIAPERAADGESLSGGNEQIRLAALARISDFTELHDGRLLLLIRGVERIQILEDVVDATASPRRVRAQRLDAALGDAVHHRELRGAILGTLLALASVGVQGADIIHGQAVELSDPGHVADFVGARLLLHPRQRLELFREVDPAARLQIVEDILAQILVHQTLDHHESGSIN